MLFFGSPQQTRMTSRGSWGSGRFGISAIAGRRCVEGSQARRDAREERFPARFFSTRPVPESILIRTLYCKKPAKNTRRHTHIIFFREEEPGEEPTR